MFNATQVLASPASLRPIVAAIVGRELFVNRDKFEAREAACEIVEQFRALAFETKPRCEGEIKNQIAYKLGNDALRAIVEQFAQAGLRFDPKTGVVSKMARH